MKRIVMLGIVLLMVFPSIGKARVWIRYSPYAHGLVPHYVGYSPYAFSHKHPSGLINEHCANLYYPYYFPPYNCPPPIIIQRQSRVVISGQPVYSPKAKRQPKEQDGKWIIYNYLRSKGFAVRIVDGFSTVSTIFLLRNKNLLIRYQNLEAEKSLRENPVWQERYASYKKKWDQKEKEYKAAGWKIGNIVLNN